MFSLFNPPFTGERTKIVLPLFDYLINQTKYEVNKVTDYYSENLLNAKTTDRLVKFLLEIQSYMNLNTDTLVNVMRNQTARMCNSYNIVSPINTGKISNQGEMYNRNNPELFISVEYPFDVKKCVTNWKALKPIRVVSHEFSDFSYGVTNGNYLSSESGICVFTIDIALLAVKYQQWYKTERYVRDRNIYLPTTHFVAKYLWTEILSTHMDNVLFNRLLNRLRNIPNGKIRQNQSYLLVDYGDRFDSLFDQLIERFKKQPTDWQQRLNSIPSLDFGTYFRAVSYPDVAPTRQIRWAMVLSKLKIVEFLLLTDTFNQNESINLIDREAIARELRTLRNDRSLELFVPEVTLSRIERLYSIVNKQQP